MNVRELIERYNAAWNAQDLDAIHELHDPDIVFHNHTADDGEPGQATLVHLARESRAFVVAPSHFQRESAYPADFPLAAEIENAGVIGRGGSAILAPEGSYLAGPLYDEEGILYAELDPSRVLAERQRFDPVGHYSRPDVLQLEVSPAARAGDVTPSTRPS